MLKVKKEEDLVDLLMWNGIKVLVIKKDKIVLFFHWKIMKYIIINIVIIIFIVIVIVVFDFIFERNLLFLDLNLKIKVWGLNFFIFDLFELTIFDLV